MGDGNEPQGQSVCWGWRDRVAENGGWRGLYFLAALGSHRKGKSVKALFLYKGARNVSILRVYFFLKPCQEGELGSRSGVRPRRP